MTHNKIFGKSAHCKQCSNKSEEERGNKQNPRSLFSLSLLSDLKPYYAELVEKQPPECQGTLECQGTSECQDAEWWGWGEVGRSSGMG